MARIVLEVQVAAPAAAIIDGLTTAEGIRSWWTDEVILDGGVGATMHLGFPIAPKPFELRVESAGDDQVRWRSVGGFPPHWVGTTVTWKLTPADGSTTVHFDHDGWASDEGPLPAAAFTWGLLLERLKQHSESGARVPLFVR